MELSPEKDFPGLYKNRNMSAELTEGSDDSHEESLKDRLFMKKKDKKDRGYSHLDRQPSSEEELVAPVKTAKPKKGSKFKLPNKKPLPPPPPSANTANPITANTKNDHGGPVGDYNNGSDPYLNAPYEKVVTKSRGSSNNSSKLMQQKDGDLSYSGPAEPSGGGKGSGSHGGSLNSSKGSRGKPKLGRRSGSGKQHQKDSSQEQKLGGGDHHQNGAGGMVDGSAPRGSVGSVKSGTWEFVSSGSGSARPPRPVFGVPLLDAVHRSKSHDGVPVPAVARQCIDCVNAEGLSLEGIYRISAPESTVKELCQTVNSRHNQRLAFPDAYCAAAVLKRFLREMPDGLLPEELVPVFESVANDRSLSKPDAIAKTREVLALLHPANHTLLGYLFLHFKRVIDHSAENKMTLPNVGVILWSTLGLEQSVLNLFLSYPAELFPGVRVKPYVFPLSPKPGKQCVDIPLHASSSVIEEELRKQESLLAQLHEEAADGQGDAGQSGSSTDSQLWDVQAVVTQLRRQLKKSKSVHMELVQPEKRVNKSLKDALDDPSSQANSSGPCFEMFEEKQLLAVQMQLKDLIRQEEEAIDKLRIRISEAELGGQDSEIPDLADSGLPDIIKGLSGAVIFDGSEELTDEEWEERAKQFEARRDELVSKIVEERRKCAHLQAQIEMVNVRQETKVVENTRL